MDEKPNENQGYTPEHNQQPPAEAGLQPVDAHLEAEAAPVQDREMYEDDFYRGQVGVHSDGHDDEVVSWEASEYVHHEKDTLWYVVLFMVGAVITTLFVLFGDWIGAAVIVVMVVALFIYANRPPRTLRYTLSSEGITIDGRDYFFEDFQSFSFISEGAIESVVLMPNRRFMPPLTLYFAPQDGDQIGEILSVNLPYADYEPDAVDKIIKKLRF